MFGLDWLSLGVGVLLGALFHGPVRKILHLDYLCKQLKGWF